MKKYIPMYSSDP